MSDSQVIQLTIEALWLILILAGPPVVAASVVGIIIAFIQAVTQIQEQTTQYTAKLFAIVFTIFITASLLGSTIYNYSDRIFSEFFIIVAK